MKIKLKIILLIISLTLTLGLISNTYSRYIADTTGEMKVLFAKWQILVNNNDITNEKTSSITLIPVLEENINVSPNSIAPSSRGYFDINIDPTNVDVSFDYTIDLNVLNEDIPDLMITKYAFLDDNYQEGELINYTPLTEDNITGTLEYNSSTKYEPFTIRIYFEWYDDVDNTMDDSKDSEIGSNAVLEDTFFKVNATISFQQKL